MRASRTAVPGVFILEPEIFSDSRGWFMECFNQRNFSNLTEQDASVQFVQENCSESKAGVLRGLHLQKAPNEQGKLVRVAQGSIYDVAVDVRIDSPSLGAHVGTILSAKNRKMMWIPPGFAHGFMALEDQTQVTYLVTRYYCKEAELTIQWDDPQLGIQWPSVSRVAISGKDSNALCLSSALEVIHRA